MRIAQLAPPFESVPPGAYGGTERVVHTLTEELVCRGHDVTLFASGDSHTSARLVPIVPEALWHQVPASNDFAAHRAAIFSSIRDHLADFDVVHSHLDYLGFSLAGTRAPAMVTTLHNRLDAPGVLQIYRAFAGVPLISISQAQRQPLPTANWLGTVPHGIDLDAFSFSPGPGKYLAFLGRVSPEKGLDVAIRVARQAGVPLRIAARPPLPFSDSPDAERDRQYFDAVIQPLLREPGVEMIGEVGGDEKNRFLGEAAALLFPIRWPEPFGLVMPESLACGTPVLALRQGSVPEVLQDGLTGFVCHFEAELVQAVGRLGELDRAKCRAEAERRFSPSVMADGYERIFEAMLASSRSLALSALA